MIRQAYAARPEFRARFETEIEHALRVASYCTARVLDHGETSDGRLYLVTEYVEGRPLSEALLEGPLEPDAVRALAVGIAAAGAPTVPNHVAVPSACTST